nr:KH domain-containing protein [Polycladomyces sp. WAk]
MEVKELIELIAKALVDHPDQVRVTAQEKENTIVYQLSVAPDDMGKVIGKQGRVAKALRTVVGSAAVKADKRVVVEIV